MGLDPLLALAQRFAVDWLDRADEHVPPQIMTPDYRVHIGDVDLVGLDAYVSGTAGQLAQFPGLALTIHDVLTDGERLALVFTEHGASVRHDLAAAGWLGVALFRVADGLLAENWTQEDYYSRRRQLASGVPDVIAAPAVAPWTTVAEPADAQAEQVVRDWLAAPDAGGVEIDDGSALVLSVGSVEVLELFGAGDRVAFAATWTGDYLGGLDDVPDTEGAHQLGCAGVLAVSAGSVVKGRVITDRLGLRRRLLSR